MRAKCGLSCLGLFLLLLAAPAQASAEDDTPAPNRQAAPVSDDKAGKKTRDEARQTVCDLIETAASEHSIPVDFFTRLIWKESSFRTTAVSPKGAQGIAQFMPGTAAERGLADPFDPTQAIPASASLLKDLKAHFGNLGLAAAAYNAGADRVTNWLAERDGLPWETRNFVAAITGKTADHWVASPEVEDSKEPVDAAPASCLDVVALLAVPIPSLEPVVIGEWAPWGIQVAGHFSKALAMRRYSSLRERHPAILGELDPIVIASRKRGRGSATFHDVRIPAQSRDEANGLCRRLKAAGASCVVLRN